MNNWKYLCIEVVALLLIQVSNIHSECSWNVKSQNNCSINCNSPFSPLIRENIKKVMKELSKLYVERDYCNDGIDLELENLKYTSDTLSPNFFTAQVKVKKLTIILLNTMGLSSSENIKTDAFRVEAFKFLKTLVLTNVNFTPIKKGTFNGLENLEVLNVIGTKLKDIEEGILDELSDTLTEFSLEDSRNFNGLSQSGTILINNLTGSVLAMEKLENVTFRYNLKTSILKNTFTGIANVKTLDLSNCHISTIEAGAFDSMNYIEILKLEGNSLTTIPDAFFSRLLIRINTQIFLKGNNFDCGCHLMPFKMSLIEHSNFVGELECVSPQIYDGHTIISSKFDEYCIPPTTVTTSTSAPMSLCLSSDGSENINVVSITPPVHRMEILQTEHDEVILVRADGVNENSVLIWFSLGDQMSNPNSSEAPNCVIGSGSSFRINNLMKNSAYTFCLMDPIEVTVSPLDCISFMLKSNSNGQPWLNVDEKNRIIGITFLACGFNTLLGLAIGVLGNKMKFCSSNRNNRFIRSYDSSRTSSTRRSRMSVMTAKSYLTRRTTNTTVQYFQNYDAPPPLPARPVSMYLMEEPVCATIRDFTSINAPFAASDNL